MSDSRLNTSHVASCIFMVSMLQVPSASSAEEEPSEEDSAESL